MVRSTRVAQCVHADHNCRLWRLCEHATGSYIEGTTWRRQHQHAPRERIGELHRSTGWSGEAPMIPSTFRNQIQPPNQLEHDHRRRDIAELYHISGGGRHHGNRTRDETRFVRASSPGQHKSTGRRRGGSTDFGEIGSKLADGRGKAERRADEHAKVTFDPTRASG